MHGFVRRATSFTDEKKGAHKSFIYPVIPGGVTKNSESVLESLTSNIIMVTAIY